MRIFAVYELIRLGNYLALSPFHILTYFNGINNNGTFVNPYLIEAYEYPAYTIPVLQSEIIASNLVKNNDIIDIKNDFMQQKYMWWLQAEYPYFKHYSERGDKMNYIKIWIGLNDKYTVITSIAGTESELRQTDIKSLDLVFEEM